jgi:hypothetical protein
VHFEFFSINSYCSDDAQAGGNETMKSSAIFRRMESQQATGRSVDSLVVEVNIAALKH